MSDHQLRDINAALEAVYGAMSKPKKPWYDCLPVVGFDEEHGEVYSVDRDFVGGYVAMENHERVVEALKDALTEIAQLRATLAVAEARE